MIVNELGGSGFGEGADQRVADVLVDDIKAAGGDDPDSDGDGYCDGPNEFPGTCDANDNCPVQANPFQEDTDTASAGDVCQCGNVDGQDGITLTDLQRAKAYLVGRTLSRAFSPDFCDTDDDDSRTIADLMLIERAARLAPVDIANGCAGYIAP